MTKLYRLLARAQMHGEVRGPGYVFAREDGERGPHKPMVITNVGGTAWRQFSEPELLPPDARPMHTAEDDPTRDEPLYELVETNIHSNPKEIT